MNNLSSLYRPAGPAEVVFKLKRSRRARFALQQMAEKGIKGLKKDQAGYRPLARAICDNCVTCLHPLFEEWNEQPVEIGLQHIPGSVEAEKDYQYSGMNILHVSSFDDAQRICQQLNQDELVSYAHVASHKRLATQVDPLRNRQWALTAMQVAEAQSISGFQYATDVSIGIIDTGVDLSHPDLDAEGIKELRFSGVNRQDTDGHGTHLIGLIAALTNNQIGISGVTQSKQIISMKALEPFSASGYYRALRYAIDHQLDVLNLSLVGESDLTEKRLIAKAIRQGTIVVAAMGNDNSATRMFPAAYPNVIAVGATDETDQLYRSLNRGSNRGRHIDLVAPGVRVLSTVPTYPTRRARTTYYDATIGTGTSVAAAFVCGAVALALAKNPEANLRQVRSALQQGADWIDGQSGFTIRYGHGRLNIQRTLQLI